jgi:L-aspartate oxidase
MGGIAVDEWGKTTLDGLWACGEASATGVHGANRLASNSLLEALVYGSRVAQSVSYRHLERGPEGPKRKDVTSARVRFIRDDKQSAQAIRDLRNVMYSNVGLVRNELGLREALARISDLERTPATPSSELSNPRAAREPRQPLPFRFSTNG